MFFISIGRTKWFQFFLVLYASTFFLVLPICLSNTRFSIYYKKQNSKSSQDLETQKNIARIKEAESYFSKFNDTTKMNNDYKRLQSNQTLDIMISIISMSRLRLLSQATNHNPKYLTQTLWKFFTLLEQARSENFPYSVRIQVCNVDGDSATFNEIHSIKNITTVVSRFPTKHVSSVHVLEKEKQDYVFCLNSSLQHKPRYSLLVEDDALPLDNLFEVLKYTIEMHLDNRYLRSNFNPSTNSTVFVKFYHPDRLLGYLSIEPERISELISSAVVCGTVVYFLLYNLTAKLLQPRGYLIWLAWTLYFLLLFIAIGRGNVNKWRNLFSPYLHSYSPAPSCCTPAVLFPYSGAQQVTSFLSAAVCKKHYAKDSVLDDLRRHKKLKAYLVQPNVFQHIGMYSTLHKTLLDPSIV